jgi:hypothetical protein
MVRAEITTETRTIHTIRVSVPDDALRAIQVTDQVEVVLVYRNGVSNAKRIGYGELVRMLSDDGRKW